MFGFLCVLTESNRQTGEHRKIQVIDLHNFCHQKEQVKRATSEDFINHIFRQPDRCLVILPLNRNQKIVLMGPNANDSTMLWGNYSGTPTKTITILEGIRSKANDVRFIQGCGLTRNEVK